MNEETARKLSEVVGGLIVIVILGVALALIGWLAASFVQFLGFAFIGWFLAGILAIALLNMWKTRIQNRDNE